MLVIKQLTVAIDFHRKKNTIEASGYWLPTFFKIYCVQPKKETQTGLEKHGKDDDKIFIFRSTIALTQLLQFCV